MSSRESHTRTADVGRVDSGSPKSGRRLLLLFLRDVFVNIVIAVVVSFLVKTFLVRSFYIPSGSMENTLAVDDRILVNALVPDVVPVQRGDIIVFKDPGGWLPPPETAPTTVSSFLEELLGFVGLAAPDSDEHLVKRVIGLPGDRVECCNTLGQVRVNGVPLDEPYVVFPAGESRASGMDFAEMVPEGSLWVMGDNRYHSRDSRHHTEAPDGAFVPIDHVVGRAFLTTWPLTRWSWLDNHPNVFAGVPTTQPATLPPSSPLPNRLQGRFSRASTVPIPRTCPSPALAKRLRERFSR